jgi:hypothetical protein
MNYTHTIQLNDTTRLAISQDIHVISPLDYLDDVGVFTVSHARGLMPLSNSLDDMNVRLANIQYNSSDMHQAIDKLFTRAGMNYKIVHLQGYSQGEWHELIVYGTHDIDVLSSVGRELDQWYKGDVYVISLEELHTYANVNNTDDTHSHWEVTEAIGGVYLDNYLDDEEVIREASMHFTIPTLVNN